VADTALIRRSSKVRFLGRVPCGCSAGLLARPHKPLHGVRVPHPLPCVRGVNGSTAAFQANGPGSNPGGRSIRGWSNGRMRGSEPRGLGSNPSPRSIRCFGSDKLGTWNSPSWYVLAVEVGSLTHEARVKGDASVTVVPGPSEDSHPYGAGDLMGCRQGLTQVDLAKLVEWRMWLARARFGPGRVLRCST
jgi:hypothetical protein